jgi:sarcosine oxidase delta subunit
MKIKRLIQCPVCGQRYLEGTPGGCPVCAGKTGVVRPLMEEAANPRKPENVIQAREAVRGWLVCVNGSRKGDFYRLINEKNLLTDEKNDRIFVRYEHAAGEGVSGMILFDDKENEFWLLNGCGRNTIRVNDRFLTDSVKLKKDDTLAIGHTIELIFIPFCGPEFRWGRQ